MVEVDRIRTIPLFDGLSEEELTRVANWIEPRNVEAGRVVVPKGESGYTFFVIEQGEVVVDQDGRDLAHLGPGDFFGEMAILGQGTRVATVTASTDATFLTMFGLEFRQLEAELPGVAERIVAAVDARQKAL
jgi:CRP-like cAMP-binding protein